MLIEYKNHKIYTLFKKAIAKICGMPFCINNGIKPTHQGSQPII